MYILTSKRIKRPLIQLKSQCPENGWVGFDLTDNCWIVPGTITASD